MDFCFQENGVGILFPTPPIKYNLNSWALYTKTNKILKSVEKKIDQP